MNGEIQVTPVPVFAYKLFEIVEGKYCQAELDSLGADGWGVAGVVLNGTHVLFARQVAVRLVPVEQPSVLGVPGHLRLAHPGNGR
jgi:hypothetical protein